jgi:hypothetical protein
MVKKICINLLSLAIVFCFVGVSFSENQGNSRKGKYLYRKIYSSCMERGEVEEAKPPIGPDSKTQAQWTRLFDKKDFTEFGCKEEWSKLSDQELLNIYTYLHSHAADSPSPAKCK